MALISFFLAGGAVLIAQGVYTLRTDDIRLLGFLMRSSTRTSRGKPSNRFIGGIFFIACGLWVLHVPFFANLQAVSLANWVKGHLGLLLVVAFCAIVGTILLAWPVAFLEWLRSSYPEIPTTERWALMIPRGIGVGMLVIAIQLLSEMLYYARG